MLEISVPITPELMDELEALFCEAIQENWLLFQKDRHSTPLLKGYFENQDAFDAAFANLIEQVPDLQGREPEIGTLEDQDWKLAYRHHLKPWKVGHLNWVPEWERETFPRVDADVYLYLDSGMAFGTGSHETTRLCAEAIYAFWTEREGEVANCNVIDAGCGSGILAMSAALLGFGEIYAFDRDPEAVKVTAENAEKNGMQTRIEIREAGLEQGLRDRRAELMVANIQADVLMIYADNLVRAWDPKGVMILSGVLAPEREKVTERFLEEMANQMPERKIATQWHQQGDWVSILFRS
ncbi:MAG: 50S ribosomal protein L11 methyltransferase [Puniceicoccaceae bacterium]